MGKLKLNGSKIFMRSALPGIARKRTRTGTRYSIKETMSECIRLDRETDKVTYRRHS